jgi:hypothetical protein
MSLFNKNKVNSTEKINIRNILNSLYATDYIGSDNLYTVDEIINLVEKFVGNGKIYDEPDTMRAGEITSPRWAQGKSSVYFQSTSNWFQVQRVKAGYRWVKSNINRDSDAQRAHDEFYSDVY